MLSPDRIDECDTENFREKYDDIATFREKSDTGLTRVNSLMIS